MAMKVDQTRAVPAYHQMLWPTLLALRDLGGSGTIAEVADRAIELAGFTEEQQQVLHKTGPGTEIKYRLAWARSYLKAVGAVDNSSRGIWTVTEYGRTLQEPDMIKIPPQVRAMKRAESIQVEPEPQAIANTPEILESEGIATTPFSSTDFDEWRDHLLAVLQSIPPSAFERLCQRLLRESDFTQVEVTGRTGDGGIDGIGVLKISLLSFQVFFQCKRYKGSVGASAIRDFRGQWSAGLIRVC